MPGKGPLDWRRGVVGVITSIAADVGDRRGRPCVLKSISGVSWTKMTLDACSRGFLTLKNLDMVPLEPIEAVTLCNALFASLAYNAYLIVVIDKSFAFYSSVNLSLIVLD